MKRKRKHYFILRIWSTITNRHWEVKDFEYKFIIRLKKELEQFNFKCLLSVR